MQEQISILKAHKAMCFFLDKYYQNTSFDDVESLLGDLQLLKSSKIADLTIWGELIKCINQTKNGNKNY